MLCRAFIIIASLNTLKVLPVAALMSSNETPSASSVRVRPLVESTSNTPCVCVYGVVWCGVCVW